MLRQDINARDVIASSAEMASDRRFDAVRRCDRIFVAHILPKPLRHKL